MAPVPPTVAVTEPEARFPPVRSERRSSWVANGDRLVKVKGGQIHFG